jgi:hypothetical protein
MAMPEITDAELDEIEREASEYLNNGGRVFRFKFRTILRLAKALRACRKEAKAKDAVVKVTREVLDLMALGTLEAAAEYGPDFDLEAARTTALMALRTVVVAHDKGVGDAGS